MSFEFNVAELRGYRIKKVSRKRELVGITKVVKRKVDGGKEAREEGKEAAHESFSVVIILQLEVSTWGEYKKRDVIKGAQKEDQNPWSFY